MFEEKDSDSDRVVKFTPMDEDSNLSTASDSLDGMTPMATTTNPTSATPPQQEGQKEGRLLIKRVNVHTTKTTVVMSFYIFVCILTGCQKKPDTFGSYSIEFVG